MIASQGTAIAKGVFPKPSKSDDGAERGKDKDILDVNQLQTVCCDATPPKHQMS